MKQCNKCGQWKDYELFYKSSSTKDGVQGKCKECSKRLTKEWKKKNPEYHLSNLLRTKYGLTVSEYDQIRKEQNYCCAICGKHEGDTYDRLHVDHCHYLGHVRGLLCTQCNTALGLFQDNPELMRAGAEYVENRKSKRPTQENEESSRSSEGRSDCHEGIPTAHVEFSKVQEGIRCNL